MGPVTISERFTDTCSPVISSNYDTCGTVTRATINHLTQDQLTALFAPGGLFADLDSWFFHSIEMKACGVRRYALYDWIMANTDRQLYRSGVTGIKTVKSPSLIQPFIFGRQETVVNRDYWKITAGEAQSAYTAGVTGPLTAPQLAKGVAADRVIRVESRHGIPMDPNWFRDRDSIHIFTRLAGVTQHGQWKTLAAASDANLTYCDVLVSSLNTGSNDPFDPAPTYGVVIAGVNNVQDYEKWCQNLPTIDPRKRVPFWTQTYRDSRCIDSEYRAVYKRLYDSNPAFREFGDLPLAERNAQDELESMKRFVNSFFFNKPIGPNQTLTLWENLESVLTVAGSVLDPGTSGKLIGKRANFIGVREQLRVCDRIRDLQNNPLNLLEFLDENYLIKRARESQNRKVTDIDWWTDSSYRATLQTAFMQYYKDQYLEQLRINVQINQISPDLGIVYDSYLVKRPGGVRINILSDEYFDDRVDEFDAQNMASAGRLLLCLDIGKPGPSGGTIFWAQIASNRKVYTTAEIDQLAKFDSTFRCVMENPTIEQTLKSETGTVVVECPKNSLWIEGVAEDVPITTGKSLNPTYTNLY